MFEFTIGFRSMDIPNVRWLTSVMTRVSKGRLVALVAGSLLGLYMSRVTQREQVDQSFLQSYHGQSGGWCSEGMASLPTASASFFKIGYIFYVLTDCDMLWYQRSPLQNATLWMVRAGQMKVLEPPERIINANVNLCTRSKVLEQN